MKKPRLSNEEKKEWLKLRQRTFNKVEAGTVLDAQEQAFIKWYNDSCILELKKKQILKEM